VLAWIKRHFGNTEIASKRVLRPTAQLTKSLHDTKKNGSRSSRSTG
jgi:hypothetical protein